MNNKAEQAVIKAKATQTDKQNCLKKFVQQNQKAICVLFLSTVCVVGFVIALF